MQSPRTVDRSHPSLGRLASGNSRLATVAAGIALLATGVAAVAVVGPAAVAATGPDSAADPVVHVDNPYQQANGQGVRGYVNPVWTSLAEQVPGGTRVAGSPTAVWIDTVAMIAGGLAGQPGLAGHLDTALAQGAGYVQVVIKDLPGKDCDQISYYSGEFGAAEVDRYQREFIDPIAAIESDPRYRSLRIINIVEPRWVQTLVTNTGTRAAATDGCRQAEKTGSYVTGVRYALTQLHQAGANVYTYLDAGAYHQLGWLDDFDPAVRLLADTVRGTPDGFASVDGFVTNIAGYAPLREPHFTIDTKIGGASVRQSRWVDWNRFVDEEPYALQLRAALVQAGFSPQIGMVIDTSRNGWGGPQRPTRPATSTDVSAFVDASRVDRRARADSWCNQIGAGLGERPAAAPRPGIDAYAWIKTPGTSDGASPVVPDGSVKGYDRACDPQPPAAGQAVASVGAMAGAPPRDAWFPAVFAQLLANAYPPVG